MEVEVTGTFKQLKGKLVEQGFDPGAIADPLYILNEQAKSYTPLSPHTYCLISSGTMQL